MQHRLQTGFIAGSITLGLLAVAVPSAQAATRSASVTIDKNCYGKVYLDNATKGKIKGSLSVWCNKGGYTWATPTISIYRDKKMVVRTEGPGLKEVKPNGKHVNFKTYTKNNKGKQCYKASLMVLIVGAGGVETTKRAKTKCLNT